MGNICKGYNQSINFNDDPYKFDLDKNGFPAFTEKNLKFLNALIENDSKYRLSFDINNLNSSAGILSKEKFPKDKDKMLDVVRKIDKENSTHLSVSGYSKENKENNNKGIDIFLEKLFSNNIDSIENRIEKGDTALVDEMAKYVPGVTKLSFASKFCTYCNRYCFNKDDYSIYDSVVCEILPYYLYVYLGETYWGKVSGKTGRKTFNIRNKLNNNKINYGDYNNLIGMIIDKIQEKTGIKVSRKDFDLMLWYYYKGDKSRVKAAKRCLCDSDKILY